MPHPQVADFEAALRAGNLRDLEDNFYPHLKAKLLYIFLHAQNKPEFFTEPVLFRLMALLSMDCVAEPALRQNFLFFTFNLAPFVEEQFYQQLVDFIKRVATISCHRSRVFRTTQFSPEWRMLALLVNVRPFLTFRYREG